MSVKQSDLNVRNFDLQPETLNEVRARLGFKPLVEPVIAKVAFLPEHMYWLFAAWGFVLTFGVLAQRGWIWMASPFAIIALSCFVVAHLRVQDARPTTYVSSRHTPYRD